jgi:hypothetical protein
MTSGNRPQPTPDAPPTSTTGQGDQPPGWHAGSSGDVAQLAEHCLCKAGVRGSIPLVSTRPDQRKRLVLLDHLAVHDTGRDAKRVGHLVTVPPASITTARPGSRPGRKLRPRPGGASKTWEINGGGRLRPGARRRLGVSGIRRSGELDGTDPRVSRVPRTGGLRFLVAGSCRHVVGGEHRCGRPSR